MPTSILQLTQQPPEPIPCWLQHIQYALEEGVTYPECRQQLGKALHAARLSSFWGKLPKGAIEAMQHAAQVQWDKFQDDVIEMVIGRVGGLYEGIGNGWCSGQESRIAEISLVINDRVRSIQNWCKSRSDICYIDNVQIQRALAGFLMLRDRAPYYSLKRECREQWVRVNRSCIDVCGVLIEATREICYALRDTKSLEVILDVVLCMYYARNMNGASWLQYDTKLLKSCVEVQKTLCHRAEYLEGLSALRRRAAVLVLARCAKACVKTDAASIHVICMHPEILETVARFLGTERLRYYPPCAPRPNVMLRIVRTLGIGSMSNCVGNHIHAESCDVTSKPCENCKSDSARCISLTAPLNYRIVLHDTSSS
jgi:hypothetical protein